MTDPVFTYIPPAPLILDFDPPLKSGKGELSRLQLREPNATDVWVAEQQLTAKNGNRASRLYQRALVARVGGVPEAALDAMPISSFTRAVRYLQAFIEAGLPDAAAEEGEPSLPSLAINFDPPLKVGNETYSVLMVNEPTLEQMSKADSRLQDMSAQRVRLFQQGLVELASGERPDFIGSLPISVLNRAAAFVMGFSMAGQATPTS